ncbi:MAG: hypothetical protein ACLQGP_40660 [Isosphaeraceae bacterium]
MVGPVLILVLLLTGADGPPAVGEGAADRITLRDGSVVLGLVTASTSGPRGSVEFLVRRDWAEKNLKTHVANWDRSTAATTRRAAELRLKRLTEWRRERATATGVGPDDRIIRWIDRERTRLANPEDLVRSTLMSVRLPHGEVREMTRRPATVTRLLRLAWLGSLPEPESMSMDQMKDALESRGYAADAAGKAPPAPLDRLLPMAAETEATWLARRAATEVAIDPDLRFLRFQDMVIPDTRAGEQPMNAMGLSTAISGLKRLLEPDQAQGQPDPLVGKLQSVAARSRIGAVVTRLAIAPDMSGVTVETTLWVRPGGDRWVPYGFRAATVRPDELRPEAGRDIAEDPQVQGAFRMVEMLGLGSIPQEYKDRSLRIGAATQKALDTARSAFNQDLDSLALPVLEPARDVAGPEAARPTPARVAAPEANAPSQAPKRPRRSILGPVDH